ncbi:phage baseplate assembly protein V [Zavarzinella formosa]|uniref:phage baseplate assembly protein V n=1 Tax=Zavarzinella formosa TaxID=360055 RepID=UPI00035D0151|nr:phage baseplate assembly protein V [Zavarzinella formosa]
MRRFDTDDGNVDPIGGGTPLSGVASAVVVDNIDPTNQGRVQLELPWLPDVKPWGRVASLSGGPDRGMYFMPQVGDEVLVAFQHGDVREVYVIGSLWSSGQKAPTKSAQDPVNRRVIVTPKGHEIELDDKGKTITVTTIDKHKIRIEPEKIEISTQGGSTKLTLGASGEITVKADASITFEAPVISVKATASLELTAPNSTLKGDASCVIKGGTVMIN